MLAPPLCLGIRLRPVLTEPQTGIREGGEGGGALSMREQPPLSSVLAGGCRYVAVYPVYITRQRSRQQREIYDDEDLQIFYEDLEGGVLDNGILNQGKKMFGRDSAFIFLAIFIMYARASVCPVTAYRALGPRGLLVPWPPGVRPDPLFCVCLEASVAVQGFSC